VWWHLLSLDAPTVAIVWSWAFAHAFHIQLPWFAPVTLGLGTWCVYVADRLLDGWRKKPGRQLRERHLFYARHRKLFVAALITAAVPLTYLIFMRVAIIVRFDDVLLAVLGLVYFVLIHQRGDRNKFDGSAWLPKEMAVGILFAIATTVPIWPRLHGEESWMMVSLVLFASVCWWNCVAIQVWEDGLVADARSVEPMHRLTVWIGRKLQFFAATLVIVSASVAIMAPTTGIRILLAACSSSGLLFLMLSRYSFKLHSRTLRVAADLALLTPLLWIALVR
jgi:hypothetical protein